MENYQIKLSNMVKIHHSSSDADGKKKVETFVEEEDAAGFGEDFFKNRIRLLTFIFTAVSLISNFIFIVNSTVNLTSILSLLLLVILSF